MATVVDSIGEEVEEVREYKKKELYLDTKGMSEEDKQEKLLTAWPDGIDESKYRFTSAMFAQKSVYFAKKVEELEEQLKAAKERVADELLLEEMGSDEESRTILLMEARLKRKIAQLKNRKNESKVANTLEFLQSRVEHLMDD